VRISGFFFACDLVNVNVRVWEGVQCTDIFVDMQPSDRNSSVGFG
jgi:hypothetical protein